MDPDHAAEYKRRANAYAAQIESLDASIKAELDAIPAYQRKVVTSASDLAKIIDQIRAQGTWTTIHLLGDTLTCG
ncbi:zinc ABC transporter solute-binding protein [Rhizobium laguerreae]|uniref:metal ABC transporter solute-binding protein, Zn/Mn family n=1 Tax=Rhizobium laguerreae TaxID=1076926 RepID=UPI001C910C8D|nr:zinc ABC transporter substrate-binding protein [Rhizobium laguerreae]MBY3088880.1 zinc ABC transporter solute-binding protein [Rhizobium laguerreae]MBY3150588.1 zinc ABC transporter solute-binding protein [Rhizobium laguerreae]